MSPASAIQSLPWRSAALFSYRRCRLSSPPGASRGADRSAVASADSTAAAIAGQSGDGGTSLRGLPDNAALARMRLAIRASRSRRR